MLHFLNLSLNSFYTGRGWVWMTAMMFRRVGGHALRCCGRRPFAGRKLPGRQFSAHSTSSATPQATTSPLGSISVELDRIAPRFEVPASQIRILDSPAAFFDTLKVSYIKLDKMPSYIRLNHILYRRKSRKQRGEYISLHCILEKPNSNL